MSHVARAMAVAVVAFAVPACHHVDAGAYGPTDLIAIDERIVTSVEFRAPGLTVIAARQADGTFVIDDTRGPAPKVRCHPGSDFGRAMRPVFHIRGMRELSASEVEPLRRTTEEGILRMQDRIAHDGGDFAPPEWRVYARPGERTPLVVIDVRENEEAWEVDLPKATLHALRAGCSGRSR